VRPELLPPDRRERGEPVRALFLSHTLLGFRRYHEKLMEFCADDAGIDAVHIELAAPLWQKVLGKGVPVVTWTGWDLQPYRHLRMWRARLSRWLLDKLPLSRFDVVHILTQGNAPDIGYLKRECARRGWDTPKFAVNVDATAELEARELGYRRRPLRPMIRAEHQIFRDADLVVTRNRWCVGSLQRDYKVEEAKIHVARNALALPPVSRADFPPRAPGAPLQLAFVGNNWARKSGPQLLAMHQAKLAPHVTLHVCSARATPDASARNVVWHGAVEHGRLMNELLPSCDALILPTRNDMHPWAVLEAASLGLPVVSTRLAGIPEMVREEETGFLCAPGDWDSYARAVLRLAADPALCETMGRNARLHIQRNYYPNASFGGLIDRLKQIADGYSGV
jgi:glycosyltransferase involved in cell wall biosynthesis